MTARRFEPVTLGGVPYMVDTSNANPGPMFFGAGDALDGTDAHARLYGTNKRLLGVYCGHERTLAVPGLVAAEGRLRMAHHVRNGEVYCPHSQQKEECQ